MPAFQLLLEERCSLDAIPGRVVLVCGSLQPGGAERQVVNTLVGLKAAQLESVTLLCDRLSAGTEERYDFHLSALQRAGIPVQLVRSAEGTDVPLPDAFKKTKILPSLRDDVASYYREFRRLRPEVVHTWLDWSNSRAGLAAILAGVPRIILSGRNISPRHFALNQDYYRPVYQALVDQPQVHLINNSRAGANDYARWIGIDPSRITVLRNGVDFTQEHRPSPAQTADFRKKIGIPPDVPVVGGMFRFNAEKRPLLWLKAAAQVLSKLPNTWFVLFGQGPMRGEMEAEACNLGLSGRLLMPGLVSPSLQGLAVCDILVLTSSGEGTPNVLLEAQWLGLPVVTTSAGGAAEAVADGTTGLVAHDDSPEAIAACVTKVLTDGIFRRSVSTEGPAFIKNRYSVERMIEDTLSVYGHALTDTGRLGEGMTTALQDDHRAEVEAGRRFEFGANWRRFLAVLNDERIAESERNLKEFIGTNFLMGKTFLDIGSGSGLSSLAARRLGAKVVSFDYDPQSVACTSELRRRYFDGDPDWQVLSGSVLDHDFLASLGTFDVVYSWGVLHHTGQMWQALENITTNTKPGGKLFIAIYNDCGEISRHWMKKKITFNRLPQALKLSYAIAVWTPIEARYFFYYLLKGRPGNYFALWTEYKKSRGMSRWHDMIDWIGGYPYEYASAQQLTKFFGDKGYAVSTILENDGYGCHQIVFDREN